MASISIDLWENKRRLRERVRNVSTMILSITAVNGFYMLYNDEWVLLAINLLFFLTTIPVFMSYSKWQKLPPREDNDS